MFLLSGALIGLAFWIIACVDGTSLTRLAGGSSGDGGGGSGNAAVGVVGGGG